MSDTVEISPHPMEAGSLTIHRANTTGSAKMTISSDHYIRGVCVEERIQIEVVNKPHFTRLDIACMYFVAACVLIAVFTLGVVVSPYLRSM